MTVYNVGDPLKNGMNDSSGKDLNAQALQSIISNAAHPGDWIVLNHLAIFAGTIGLTTSGLPGQPIMMVSDQISTASGGATLPFTPGTLPNLKPSLPWDQTQRVTPSNASLMPKIYATIIGYPALATANNASGTAGSSYWTMQGIEFACFGPYLTGGVECADLVLLDGPRNADGTTAMTQDLEQPNFIVFDQCYFHGQAGQGGSGTCITRRGLRVNGKNLVVQNCSFNNIKTWSADNQCINGWGGSGPISVINNFLEGTTENILFGGGYVKWNVIPGQTVWPAGNAAAGWGIYVRYNTITKNPLWNSGYPGYQRPTDSSPQCDHWSVKNLVEFKNATNVLVDGNFLQYSWPPDQQGAALGINVSTGFGPNPSQPYETVTNLTFSNNIVDSCTLPCYINYPGLNVPPQVPDLMRSIRIENNLFTNMSWHWGRYVSQALFPIRAIKGLTLANNTVRLDPNFESGMVTSATTNTLTDTNKSWSSCPTVATQPSGPMHR